MRTRPFVKSLILAFLGLFGSILYAEPGIETKSFPVQPGDTLALNNDFGSIVIRPREGATLEARITKKNTIQGQKNGLEIAASKSGATAFFYVFFSGAPGESVDMEIKVPAFMNLMIWGANPDVDISGIRGTVRVQDLTGHITAENLISAASLITDRGDIIYRSGIQPQGDIRLETSSGNISCELQNGLNLRSWIRAGGKISWDMDPMIQATSVEKQLGTFGPLLYIGSLQGNVAVRLKPGAGAQLASASGQPTPSLPPLSSTVPVAATAKSSEPIKRAGAANQSADSAPAAPSQKPQSEASAADARQPVVMQGGYALKVAVDSVFLNVSVRERSTNRAVPGLRKEDFVVYEDGVRQKVDQMLPSEAPFNLLLLLDVSGSTASYLHLMKQAAVQFIRELKPNDKVAIATFNSRVQLIENFTNDRAAAEQAIQRIRSGGGTAFYDALATCIDTYLRGVEGRSAIVVFTDGVDNQLEGNRRTGSSTTFDDLYRRVQEADAIIYTIFLDTEGYVSSMSRGPARMPGGGYPGGRRRGVFPGGFPLPIPMPGPTGPAPTPRRQVDERAVYEEARDQLLEIAEQTGGRMYSPHKIDELSGVYSEIADDLRIQYMLGYNSSNRTHDGQWRNVQVAIVDHPEAVARTRKGYYARRDNT